MSWTCSQVLADQFSQANLITTEQSLQLKSTRTAERFYFDGKKRGTSKRSPSGMTSTPSTLLSGMASLMSSLLGSPVKDSRSQANKEEQPTPETNGRKRNELSKKFDQAELFSKTSRESESTSESWPEILPIWGMIQGGELFPLEKPEPCTFGRDGIVWPTPRSRDWKAGYGPRYLRKRSSPLPDTVDYNENYETIWPTPNAHEPRLGYQDRSKGKKGTRLNPDWVEWLMGWPIGWTSLDPLPAENFDAWVALLSIGEWWHNDPAECGSVHRLTSKVPTRKQRLIAIGNGWVPQQAILAQQILTLA